MTSFGEEFAKKLIASHLVYPNKVSGWTAQEIQTLMEKQGVERLPEVFRSYFAHVGYGSECLFLGESYGYGAMTVLKDFMKSTMAKDKKYADQFREDAFVFVSHNGYWYAFILTDNEDDDPPVYQYEEDNFLKITHAHLSEFFNELLEWTIRQRDAKKRK